LTDHAVPALKYPDCEADPVTALEQMFVDLTMRPRITAGQQPARRAVFLKPHGVAHGTFTIDAGLPPDLAVGVFGFDSFPCWVRFASDTMPLAPDRGTTLGFAIKLLGVPGAKLLPGEQGAETQDFVLQFVDRFFVPNGLEMCRFTFAGVVKRDYNSYLATHPTTAEVLKEMARDVPGVFATAYWSVLPYKFGPDAFVKYKVTVDGPALGAADVGIPADDPNYLRNRLRTRLLSHDVRLAFHVQRRTSPDTMPLDDATVAWSEQASEPVRVATVFLPAQDVDAPGQGAYGENLAFNPWHSLPEHRPVGSLNEARKHVYRAAADLRRRYNGVPAAEPTSPRTKERES
jgi:hypothetical protein